MNGRIRWLGIPTVVLLVAAPGDVRGQCATDLIEEGVEAYRDLDLERATTSLDAALSESQVASGRCTAERAPALTFLGAVHWFSGRPDSALASFRRSVVEAPDFRPDGMVFPPEITDLYDRARRTTPTVAVAVDDVTEIGGDGRGTVDFELDASIEHTVEVNVGPEGGDGARILFRGTVGGDPSGTMVRWDGRYPAGSPASPGSYVLRVVSLDALSGPVGGVEVPLTVEVVPGVVDVTDRIRTSPPEPHPPPPSLDVEAPRGSRQDPFWKAMARAGAGLLGGSIVVALPWIMDDPPGIGIRYPVAGALGVAGIVGLVRYLREGEAPPPTLDYPVGGPPDPAPIGAATPLDMEMDPTVRIRAGTPRRLDPEAGGGPP